jgi:dihydrofolate synthase / folylpolyglutamate synthase
MTLNSLNELQDFIREYIPKSVEQKYNGDWGLARTKKLLELAGNPQEKLKVVHIAGTSGKGSTAFLTSQILISQGFKVGLTVSPFMFDFREIFQISGQLLSENKVIEYFLEFKKYIDQVELEVGDNGSIFEKPTYHEIIASFAYFVFDKEQVDYAVIEVFMGGLFDCTNTVLNSNKICVINQIGYDHTEILGNTIEEIAAQKSGIIQPQNQVIAIEQEYPLALEIITNQAVEKQSELTIIRSQNIVNYSFDSNLQSFDFVLGDFVLKDLKLAMLGRFQVENCALALAVLEKLAMRDEFIINETALRKTLEVSHFSGRMELLEIDYKNQHKKILLDGAHNDQKMAALISNLKDLFADSKFDFLISFSNSKDSEKMLQHVCSVVDSLTVAEFILFETKAVTKKSYDLEQMQTQLDLFGFKNYSLEANLEKALEMALESLPTDKILVITGSLYFLSFIYKELEKIKSI